MKDKMRCPECDWVGPWDSALRAPHPFIEGEEVRGCPECRDIEDFILCCDIDGCIEQATMGTPTKDGYRQTCYKHAPSA